MKKPNVVAIIPARHGSVRLTAKPLVNLCGKPMIQHVYERTTKATLVNEVIIATDHKDIEMEVKKFGGNAVMTPTELQSGSDRIAFVAEKLKDVDIVVNVQGDEPLINPMMIDEAVNPFVYDVDSKLLVGTVVKKIQSSDEIWNPNIVKVVLDAQGFAVYFSRSPIPYLRDNIDKNSWHLHHTFYKHFGLYVFRRNFLLQFSKWNETILEKTEKLEQLRIIENGHKIKTVITDFDSISVDTLDDADRVRKILAKEKVRSL